MAVKVLVRVDRETALNAIRTLDAFKEALAEGDVRWPRKLKRKYQDARAELVQAVHHLAHCNGLADAALPK
jgi:hypothetical protein